MNISPSLYAHTLSGGILMIGILYLVFNISKILSRDPYQILVLILLLSVTIGIHGISHAGLESVYGYNPLAIFTGKPKDI